MIIQQLIKMIFVGNIGIIEIIINQNQIIIDYYILFDQFIFVQDEIQCYLIKLEIEIIDVNSIYLINEILAILIDQNILILVQKFEVSFVLDQITL